MWDLWDFSSLANLRALLDTHLLMHTSSLPPDCSQSTKALPYPGDISIYSALLFNVENTKTAHSSSAPSPRLMAITPHLPLPAAFISVVLNFTCCLETSGCWQLLFDTKSVPGGVTPERHGPHFAFHFFCSFCFF